MKTSSLLILLCLVCGQKGFSQTPTDTLKSGFVAPPEAAKPRVWWHWMNGNVTKEGITKDLEWMKRVGIGGMQQFEASLNTPRVVEKPIIYQTPAWKETLRHTSQEATRLGLEWTLSAAGGWSETGGPMVKPQEAMKKVVWSETRVTGGKRFSGQLTAPPSVNSPFLDAPKSGFSIDASSTPDPSFYRDFAAMAYRLPEEEVRMMDLKPIVTVSGGTPDMAALTDGKLAKTIPIKVESSGTKAWIQFEFAQPFKTSAVSIASLVSGGFFPVPATGQVLSSTDGKNFAPLVTFPGSTHRPAPMRTYAFPETSARFYRVEFMPMAKDGYDITAGFSAIMGPQKPPTEYNVGELEFFNTARVNHWEDKAAYGLMYEYQSVPTPPTASAIDPAKVIDLTGKLQSDGSLVWDVPAGKWAIVRMGYSLTGQKNSPAPPELTGYEADKLSKQYMTTYLDNYLKPYLDAIGDRQAGKGLQYVLLDSWEANLQNWTDAMLTEFQQRNGYDARPYLPVLTGRVVGSADISDRFLWDFRRTIADLIVDNHYQTVTEYLHQRGLKVYGEAIGAALGTMGDGLKSKGRVDIPMGEFWTENPGKFREEHPADILEAASAAHIYGKRLVASESFTDIARPFGPPSYLKYMADHYLGLGVNRFVIHTSVHQPLDDKKPGFTLAIFGQHYTRQNTWAEQSVAWNRYLARCSYLLQQGLFVGDIAYFNGEDAPAVSTFWANRSPAVPEGYKFDLVNAEVLISRMRVENGRLVLPDGMSYRLLVLPDKLDKMTLPLLSKLKEVVAAGAVVLGPKPLASPGLAGYPGVDAEVRNIANELWGATNGRTITANAYGKGKVYWGKPVAEVLKTLQTPEDLAYTKPDLNTELSWIHRQANGTHLYFVANGQHQPEALSVRFRVSGLVPELWDADKGTTEAVDYTSENGFTTIPLQLAPYGSVFVVFRQPARSPSLTLAKPQLQTIKTITGPWQVRFPALFDNTTQLRMDTLYSWTVSTDTTIRYFSGTGTYSQDLAIDQKSIGKRLLLDLGNVREMAEVSLNGKDLGILWKPPFEVDISGAAKAGVNKLEVKVTNLWTNRMTGDSRLPPNKRYTFATNAMFGPPAPSTQLLPSGLLGPVTIKIINPVK